MNSLQYNRGGRRDDGRQGGRDFRRPSFGRSEGPKQMHKATCSECGNICEVPFRPTGERPVFCSECFGRSKGRTQARPQSFRSSDSPPAQRSSDTKKDFDLLNTKLDKVLSILKGLTGEKTAAPAASVQSDAET